jgi:3-methyladenine DNA glycosylase AlkD
MYHVKKNTFCLTQEIVLKNLQHPHDLIHKANGWLLREIGKKNESILLSFIDENYKEMPRTTLRYSIEKLENDLRKRILHAKIK